MKYYEITFRLNHKRCYIGDERYQYTFGGEARMSTQIIVKMSVTDLVEALNKFDFREIDDLNVKECEFIQVKPPVL